MKKAISLLMAILMLLSLGITGYAAEETTFTPALILDKLVAEDEACETAEDQAANGALRLAEMVVALDSLSIETQDEADHLNNILAWLSEVDVPEESIERKLAGGAIKTFEAFVIFAQQVDPDGIYEDELQQMFDSFLANDEATDGAKQQAVNGLYHSVLVTSLIARGFCKNQDMANQIGVELAAFDKADKEDTTNNVDQMLLGSETLFRMLTAVASLIDQNGDYSAELHELSENTYSADSEDAEPMYRLANWLYGCVYMTDMIAKEVEA